MSGLVSGLQNRVRRFESARYLRKSFSNGTLFLFLWCRFLQYKYYTTIVIPNHGSVAKRCGYVLFATYTLYQEFFFFSIRYILAL